MLAAVRNHLLAVHLLAVQNHFRWFRTKRARPHKLARRHSAACDLRSYVCLHGRGSALLAAVQNHLLAVQNHFRWFRTKRARLHKLARRHCMGAACQNHRNHSIVSEPSAHALARRHFAVIFIHGHGRFCTAGGGSEPFACGSEPFPLVQNQARTPHKLARRHLAACDLRSYVCLHGRGSALLAAVQNHLLAVQNHFRWFRTKRARLHKLARRLLAACNLLPFACMTWARFCNVGGGSEPFACGS